jgi:glutamate dehydrogenase/leucine dehydrogenase
MMSFDEINEKVWSMGAEIFLPCAASRLITHAQVDQMIGGGLEVISSGANVPFADPQIFFGPIGDYTDDKVSLLPDFIANCGMARVFAYCMSDNYEQTDEAIFSDASITIGEALQAVYNKNNDTKKIAKTAFEIALAQLI